MAREILSENPDRIIYREEGTICKEFAADFPKEEVFHEAFINARAEAVCGGMVPEVLSVDCPDGKWILRRKYAEGETLEALMRKNPEKKETYLGLLLEVQTQLHAYRAPLLEQLKDKMARQINELAIDESTRYELLTRLSAMPRHEKLCHGDLRPSNVILGEKGDCHVIDWVHGTKGNASADVARTYLILALQDREGAEAYLDMFCQKTGTKKSYVQDWLPLVAAAQLTKKRPEEEAELKSWLQICDHM